MAHIFVVILSMVFAFGIYMTLDFFITNISFCTQLTSISFCTLQPQSCLLLNFFFYQFVLKKDVHNSQLEEVTCNYELIATTLASVLKK